MFNWIKNYTASFLTQLVGDWFHLWILPLFHIKSIDVHILQYFITDKLLLLLVLQYYYYKAYFFGPDPNIISKIITFAFA